MLPISRVTRSKEEARASYNRISTWYDVLAGRFEKKYRDTGLHMLDPQKGETALEIGFGTGDSMVALARSVGSEGRVFGIDISDGMITLARSKLRAAGLSDRVALMCGDGAHLPYGAEFFDILFMSFTLELFDTPEIPVVLHECRRVLKNGGRVCVVAMAKKDRSGFMIRLYEWLHRKFPDYADCRPIYPQEALKDAGFNIVTKKDLPMWGLPVEIVLARKP